MHNVPQQSCHVEILRHKENMTEVLQSCSLHRDGDFGLADLLKHEFENVLAVLEAQTVSQDLS